MQDDTPKNKIEEYKNYQITISPMEDDDGAFDIKVMPLLPEMEGWHDLAEVEGSLDEAFKVACESVDANHRLYNESIS